MPLVCVYPGSLKSTKTGLSARILLEGMPTEEKVRKEARRREEQSDCSVSLIPERKKSTFGWMCSLRKVWQGSQSLPVKVS